MRHTAPGLPCAGCLGSPRHTQHPPPGVANMSVRMHAHSSWGSEGIIPTACLPHALTMVSPMWRTTLPQTSPPPSRPAPETARRRPFQRPARAFQPCFSLMLFYAVYFTRYTTDTPNAPPSL